MSLEVVRSKLFIFGGVGGTNHVYTLDTGLEGHDDVARVDAAKAMGEQAMEAAAVEVQETALEERRVNMTCASYLDQSKGLNTTAAAKLVALLQSLGLNKYARTFLLQEVDVDALVHLSDVDLKDMGVHALGARRKLLAAIHRHTLKRLHAEEAREGSEAMEQDDIFRERFKFSGVTHIGGSAVVKMGLDMKGSRAVAVKMHSREDDFVRELKLLKHLRSQYSVQIYDAYNDSDSPVALVLEAGTLNLSQYLAQHVLAEVERKHVFERVCSATLFFHSKSFIAVDLKPQNIVLFGSLMNIKFVDFEAFRRIGEPLPFKLTPFYVAPEIAAATLETMRVGLLPSIEWVAHTSAPKQSTEVKERWGSNLERLVLLSDNKTLAAAVAAASSAAQRTFDPLQPGVPLGWGRVSCNVSGISRPQRPADILLRGGHGKPVRANEAQDAWPLGMLLFELFANEPYFSGCSDDVALQVLSSPTSTLFVTPPRPYLQRTSTLALSFSFSLFSSLSLSLQVLTASNDIEVPPAKVPNQQALHLLSKLLVKKPKERTSVSQALRHAYLTGGLDTQEVQRSFAMLHESQQQFKDALLWMQDETKATTGSCGDSIG